jgi:hypothetical protein
MNISRKEGIKEGMKGGRNPACRKEVRQGGK